MPDKHQLTVCCVRLSSRIFEKRGQFTCLLFFIFFRETMKEQDASGI